MHQASHMRPLHDVGNTLLFPNRAIWSVSLKAMGRMRAKRQITRLITAFQRSIWPGSDYSENKNLDIKIWLRKQEREACATKLRLPFNIVRVCFSANKLSFKMTALLRLGTNLALLSLIKLGEIYLIVITQDILCSVWIFIYLLLICFCFLSTNKQQLLKNNTIFNVLNKYK